MMGCATVTSFGLNPNTTEIANGRAYYRITKTKDPATGTPKWIRTFYTDTQTGFNGVIKPAIVLSGKDGGGHGNVEFKTNYPYLYMYIVHEDCSPVIDDDFLNHQPKTEDGWFRILYPQIGKNDLQRASTFGLWRNGSGHYIIREKEDGAWEIGMWDPGDVMYETIYIKDDNLKLKIKIWDKKDAQNGWYALAWDDVRTLIQLLNSPTSRTDLGVLGNVKAKISAAITDKFISFMTGDDADTFEISDEMRTSMLYLSMIYLGANPNATELLFSPTDANVIWN